MSKIHLNQSINYLLRVGIQKLKTPKAFTDYWQAIDNTYENLEDNNPTKKRRVLVVRDDKIADMESNRKLSSICF